MKIVKTAKLKITSHNKILDATIDIYNKALSFYIEVVNYEYQELLNLKTNKDKMVYIEKLSHKTSKNPNTKYDFDKYFYKFPSYLRRACINEAIGIIDSHYTRLSKYNKEKAKKLSKGKRFNKKTPTLNFTPKSFPTLYKDNMFEKIKDGIAKIKVYLNNDWIWLEVKYNTKNLKSSNKCRFSDFKEYTPTLIKKNNKYYLHIPYEKNVKLNSTPLKKQKICGVDLGLTNSAVCSIIDCKGTVLDRLFINQSKEKDLLKKKLNKLAKAKRQSGLIKTPNYWRKISNLQQQIAQDTINRIIEFALKHNVDVIVFEYLGKFKVPRDHYGAKKLRAKLQFWNKYKIQNLTTHKAHLNGIRVSRVLARGTSQYAYDGSGELDRNSKKDIAIFSSGKIYHTDLNASYNIGARYFIRGYLKPLSEMVRLQLEAKVPLIVDRSRQTLASLIRLSKVA